MSVMFDVDDFILKKKKVQMKPSFLDLNYRNGG